MIHLRKLNRVLIRRTTKLSFFSPVNFDVARKLISHSHSHFATNKHYEATNLSLPPPSSQGATAGFVAALCFNLWIVIGKFTYGAGQSPVLPTSTEGCPVLDVVFDGTLEGSRAPFVNSTDYSIYNGSSAAPGYSQLFNE